MNKRGSHADWAISMGIFLVYLLVLFIIIRPGIEPVHNEDVLLDIVEEKFSDDVKWIVKMSPLFVRMCSGGRSVTVTVKSKDWDFKEVLLDGKSVYDTGYCIPKGDTFVLTCGKKGDRICPSASGKNFELYYVPGNKEKRDKDPNLILDCIGTGCSAELGASEDLEGVNWRWLEDLRTEGERENGYEKVKGRWNFPESKGFFISIDGDKVIGEEPYKNVDVFVREWKDWEVSEKGERKEVVVNVKVW